MDGTPCGPMTDRDLIEDNLGCSCLKTFETANENEEKWCTTGNSCYDFVLSRVDVYA